MNGSRALDDVFNEMCDLLRTRPQPVAPEDLKVMLCIKARALGCPMNAHEEAELRELLLRWHNLVAPPLTSAASAAKQLAELIEFDEFKFERHEERVKAYAVGRYLNLVVGGVRYVARIEDPAPHKADPES